jgi:TM2 domain-containing membrane protein YozV
MLQDFFILCSGADSELLKTCSKGEQNKYAGIGATVFFTAVMAFIASSYALFTVFDNMYIAVFFGLIWGLLIFNLDRFIVSTIKKRNHISQELLQATPRILLAVIIAVVISKPLEMKLFEKEINQVLLEQKNELTLANKEQLALQYTPKVEQLHQEIATLKSEVDIKVAETNALYDTYISEAEGTAGTKLLGKGPVYTEKREKHDAALAELNTLKSTSAEKIKGIETAIAALDSEYANVVQNSQPIIDGFDGLMARINALGELAWFPSFFIFLLFLAIETSPIIAKLLAPKGEYDLKLEESESILSSWVAQKVTQRQLVMATDADINQKIYEDLKGDSELYGYKKKKAEELLRLQADNFHNIQIKGLK